MKLSESDLTVKFQFIMEATMSHSDLLTSAVGSAPEVEALQDEASAAAAAPAGEGEGTLVKLEDVQCSICLDVLKGAVRLRPCLHAFCSTCVDAAMNKKCPLCRASVDTVQKDLELRNKVEYCKLQCEACQEAFLAKGLATHEAECEEKKKIERAIKETTSRKLDQQKNSPNRSTFECPFPDCDAAHMDGKALIEHFDTLHPGKTCSAVCPVCVAMPWGDPTYISSDVVGHIRLRHKFDYNEFVNYREAEGNEDAILQQVLQASLAEP